MIELDNEEDHDVQGRDVRDICFLRMNGRYFLIKSLSDSIWSWCEEVVFGALVDTVRGCVTFRLNGVDGPCLFLGADWWGAEGVRIELSDFPGPGWENGGPLPLIVSCATPPVPPSLLEAAANPLTGAEHVAAGSMEYDADVYDSEAEYGRWEDEDESNDEDESYDDHGFSLE